jgi:thioredoxin reductase (NADPH)
LAAAVYGASEGLSTLVLDGRGPGGQAGASMRIENYLGFPTGITSAELMGCALLQAQKFGAEFSTSSAATELDVGDPFPAVRIEGGERVAVRCVLIATGADYNKLDAPDRERFEGLGVYYAATHTELASCRGAEFVALDARSRTVPAGDQPPRGVRRRRCPARLGQALFWGVGEGSMAIAFIHQYLVYSHF